MKQRLALLALLAAAVAAFFALDLQRYVSFTYLKAAQGEFQALYAARPALVLGGYFAAYVLMAAVSLPGAAVMTLAGGALFGLWTGTLVVSFAASIGATLAMLASRYLLRDLVRARFGKALAEVDRGIEREGAFYLVALRLVPLFPFFVVNLLMGLTAMRVLPYHVASQLGMLPATFVFVNAGTQLAKIDSPAGILSLPLVLSFTLLGLFPLVAKKGLDLLQARRVYAPWAKQRPRRFDRNLVVIGAGAAGLVTSYIAAAVKAKVTLVERHRMGGDCLNYGCVPSKALIRAATLAHEMRHAEHFGVGAATPVVDFAAVMDRVAASVRAIEPHDSVERYRGLGVDALIGEAHLVDPWRVRITAPDGTVQVLTTKAIVIATGAAPVLPPLPGLAEAGCLTSDTLWGLRELPARLLVLGGGPIGCELAQAFARLGSQVTLVEMAPRLLLREDEDVSALVQQALQADGVAVHTAHQALRCEGRVLVAKANGIEVRLPFDRILCAVGRRARLEGFGLEALGVEVGRTVQVNAFLQTKFPNILAAGDVAGPWQFTHTAAHQAWYAAVNGLFAPFRRFRVDGSVIPACTFTSPEVARVGLNRSEAEAQGVAFEAVRYELAELDRAIVDGATEGWVEVLTPPGRDRILGATIVGAHAGELLAEFTLAMKHGLGLKKVLGTIHAYPTFNEANKYAAGQWQRAHAPQALLRWVERFHAWRRGA